MNGEQNYYNLKHVNCQIQKMAMFLFGKLLIAVGICLQAYTLCRDPTQIKTFDTKLNTFLTQLTFIPLDITILLKLYLRFVIIGLLSCSGLMVIFRTCLLKLALLFGLILRLVIYQQVTSGILHIRNRQLWFSISIIGGIIYLIGAQTCRSKKPKHQLSPEKQHLKNKQNKPKYKTT